MTPRGLVVGDPVAEQALFEVLLTDHGQPGPYEGYRRLRERAARLRTSAGLVVLSGYGDCEAALRNRELGKVDESVGFQLAGVPEELQRRALRRFRRTMLFRNPPDHTRLRRLVSSVFTARHVEALRPAVVHRIDELLDGFTGRDVVDVISDLALPLPVSVIGDLLGIPDIDRAAAAPWVRDLVAPLEPSADLAAVQAAVDAEDHLAEYFADLLAHKRRRPGDDLLSRLATARGDDQLGDDEWVGTAFLLFGPGFGSNTNLVGTGLAAVLGAPDQRDLLRDRPDLAGPAVEELLRFDAPVQTDGRTALADTTVGDLDVADGQVVLLLLGAGNRDPAVFTDPHVLDITRSQATSLSFGGGLHFCLGAPLARMEAEEQVPRLLARFPRLESASPSTWRTGLSFRGQSHLPLRPGPPVAA